MSVAGSRSAQPRGSVRLSNGLLEMGWTNGAGWYVEAVRDPFTGVLGLSLVSVTMPKLASGYGTYLSSSLLT